MMTMGEFDLSRPAQYMVERMGYAAAGIPAIVKEYHRFISLVVTHPGMTIPTCKEVDDLWHAHILCTHQYLDMCKKLGVEYIHHNPCLEADRGTIVSNYNDDTLGLLKEHFGDLAPIWTADQELCSGDKDYCGGIAIAKHLRTA